MSILIYRGPSTQERCAEAAQLLSEGDEKAAAKRLHVTKGTLKKLAAAHLTMARYVVTLTRDGDKGLTLCEVVTPNGVLDATIAAFKKHRRTLNRLELPGWRLKCGSREMEIADIRAEASGARRRA